VISEKIDYDCADSIQIFENDLFALKDIEENALPHEANIFVEDGTINDLKRCSDW